MDLNLMNFSNFTIWFVCFLLIITGSTLSSWNSLISINGLISAFSLVIAALAFMNAKKTRDDNQKYKLIELKREVTKGFAELINSWNNAKIIVEKSEITKKEYSDFVEGAAKNAKNAYDNFQDERDCLTMDKVVEYLLSIDYMQVQMRGDIERMEIKTQQILALERKVKNVNR
ncbi:hypothetical protein [Pseudoalteromonas phenolica]|uniref:hypothetical protein n=1 Tax=Pseudoalteromonas phenolica TaxID=161398 RepID=UPI00384FD942